jgi:hypothetical protein
MWWQKRVSHVARLLRIKLGDKPSAAFHHHVLVDGIEHLFALLTAGHEIKLPENAEVMRDGRLGYMEGIYDVAHALLALQKHFQDPLAGVVGQSLAEFDTVNRHVILLNI